MANEAYQDVNQLIKDLINRENARGLNIDNFSGSSFDGVADAQPLFWKKLLLFLHDNVETGYHSPILQSYFHDAAGQSPSVFSFINGKADLSNNFWNYLTTSDSPYWNESLDALIRSYSAGDGDIYWDTTNADNFIAINSILHADAGNSFTDIPWVVPWINIDRLEENGVQRNYNYMDVRGSDAIESVLKNSNQLQFTHVQGSDWIRLIMPKYLRKVEVEDLNRNFWVIGQVLSGVCAYLFKNNTLDNLFEGILKELLGLWENVLFLWAATAMSSQKTNKITNIHVEFMPIPNSDLQSFRKFDDFDNARDFEVITGVSDTRFEALMRRIKGVLDQYDNSNVVIIPEIREHNYKHNYYSRVAYPGMLVYNRNTGAYYWSAFQYEVSGNQYPFYIDLEDNFLNPNSDPEAPYEYVSKLPGLREKDEITYQYHYPFGGERTKADGTTVITGTQDEDEPYYGAVRVYITGVNAEYDVDTDTITISYLTFIAEDPFTKLTNNSNIVYGSNWGIYQFTQDEDAVYVNDTYPATITLNRTSRNADAPYWLPVAKANEGTSDIIHGYYLGEMVSCCSKIVPNTTWNITEGAYWGQQLFTATPQEIIAIMEAGS